MFNDKYVGKVVDNNDPKKLGRLKVSVPNVYGNIGKDSLIWAEPSFPYGGSNDTGIFFIPEIGSLVEVTFTDGSPYKPVWCGSIYREEGNVNIPVAAAANYPDRKIIRTKTGYLLFDDKDKFIELKHESGSLIRITDSGSIVLQNNDMSGTCNYTIIDNESNHILFKTKNKCKIEIENDSIIVQHFSGSYIAFSADGDITIHAMKDLRLQANKNVIAHPLVDLKLHATNSIDICSYGGIASINSPTGIEFSTTSNILLHSGADAHLASGGLLFLNSPEDKALPIKPIVPDPIVPAVPAVI